MLLTRVTSQTIEVVPISRTEYIAWLRNKRMEVTENSDGSFSISDPRRQGHGQK
jgi:hypothetical protein